MAHFSLSAQLARNLRAKSVPRALWVMFVALLLNPFLVSYFHTTFFFKTKRDNFVEGFGGIYRIQRRAQDSGRGGSRLDQGLGSRNSWIFPRVQRTCLHFPFHIPHYWKSD